MINNVDLNIVDRTPSKQTKASEGGGKKKARGATVAM